MPILGMFGAAAPRLPRREPAPQFDPNDEAMFQTWYRANTAKAGLDPNPDAPEHKYDYRRAYIAGAMPGKDGHWPSEFKAPDHPNRYVDGMDTITGEPVTAAPKSSVPPMGMMMRGPEKPKPKPGQDGGLFRVLGYRPEETGQGLGEWLFSDRADVENAKKEVSTRAALEQQRAQLSAQVQTLQEQGYRPDQIVAFLNNPEKFAENIAEGLKPQTSTFYDPRTGQWSQKPQDMMSVAEGTDVFDPNAGKSVYSNDVAPKPETLPEGMRMGPNGPEEIPGYVSMRSRIAAAGRAPSGVDQPTAYQQWQMTRTETEDARKQKERDDARFANKSRLQDGIELVNQFVGHKGFDGLYGAINGRVPDMLLMQDQLDAKSFLDQIGGQAFLTGVEKMRGTGPLSDNEGKRVAAAVTRLTNRSQSPEAARLAANEFVASMRALETAYEKESGGAAKPAGMSPTRGEGFGFTSPADVIGRGFQDALQNGMRGAFGQAPLAGQLSNDVSDLLEKYR